MSYQTLASGGAELKYQRYRQEGYDPFTGFPGPHSTIAYIQCALELVQQSVELDVHPDYIFAGSAGSSLAGLVAGFSLLGKPTRFVGVPQRKVGPPREAAVGLAAHARKAAEHIGLSCAPDPDRIFVDDRHTGPGFGALDPPTREAIQLLARTEGILVDPAYTGKGLAGLLAHIREDRLAASEDVVFVHTGGTPLTFVYGAALL